MIKLGIVGACGRMGKRIAFFASDGDFFEISAALEQHNHSQIGKDYGSVAGIDCGELKVSGEITGSLDVIIDFTSPASTMHWVEVCKAQKISMVIGTTGLGDEDLEKIKAVANTIPIVQAPNMSVGMNVLFRMVGEAAKLLGEEYDVEIVEHHHRFKKDAPSGSALGLLNSIAESKGENPDDIAIFGRHGLESTRKEGEIAVHSVRLGDTVGEHKVYFGNLGETITFSHSVHTRDTFALGAIRAAKWIVGKTPGLYSMRDVLFDRKDK